MLALNIPFGDASNMSNTVASWSPVRLYRGGCKHVKRTRTESRPKGEKKVVISPAQVPTKS